MKSYGARGVSAAFVGRDQHDQRVNDEVIKGHYSLVYICPESMLTNLKFREMFRSSVYQRNLVCLAIDEAYCVEKW